MSDRLPERYWTSGYYFLIFVFMAGIFRKFVEILDENNLRYRKPLNRMEKSHNFMGEDCWGMAL